MNGILVVNKPKGYTSRDVVNVVSSALKAKKIGHTGTLDPLATGVLVLCVGKYTKLVSLLTSHEKEYIATIQFGKETDTLDITGTVLKESSVFPSEKELKRVLTSFLGTQIQEVPLYSAKKVNGRRLYEYARNGASVEVPTQEITVKELKLLDYQNHQAKIFCKVSKGTYIRSLIRDISHACDTFGTMKELNRIKQGEFSLEQAFSLNDIIEGNYHFLTYEDLFDYDRYALSMEEYKRVCNGNQLFLQGKKYILLTYTGKNVAIYHHVGDSYRPLFSLTTN